MVKDDQTFPQRHYSDINKNSVDKKSCVGVGEGGNTKEKVKRSVELN
jgi:hypothetical protein